jgi:ribosome-associated protein
VRYSDIQCGLTASGAPPDRTCNALRVERSVEITGYMIRLGQLLKLAGAASGGAEAKALIASGQVTVNGEPELRRGRQLHAGDVVRVDADDLRIVAAPARTQDAD